MFVFPTMGGPILLFIPISFTLEKVEGLRMLKMLIIASAYL